MKCGVAGLRSERTIESVVDMGHPGAGIYGAEKRFDTPPPLEVTTKTLPPLSEGYTEFLLRELAVNGQSRVFAFHDPMDYLVNPGHYKTVKLDEKDAENSIYGRFGSFLSREELLQISALQQPREQTRQDLVTVLTVHPNHLTSETPPNPSFVSTTHP